MANGLGLLPETTQTEIGERLQALPLALEVETSNGLVGLVHADCPFDDWQDMHQVPWANLDPTSAVADCCLWSWERYQRKYLGSIKNIRAVVQGHMTIESMEVLGNVYYIDTGGWRPGGHFTFLELETLEAISSPRRAGAQFGRANR